MILVYLYINALTADGLDLSAIIIFGYDLLTIAVAVLAMVKNHISNS